MKFSKLFLSAILTFCISDVYSQSASAIYPLTSTTTTAVTVSGNLTGTPETFSGMAINNYSGPNSSQRVTTLSGSWPGDPGQVEGRYIQFSVTPAAGNNFIVDSVLINLGAAGGSNMRANIRYSKDSTFATSVLLNSSILALPSGAFLSPAPNYGINHTVYDGETFYLRIYPWYTSSSTGKYVCPQNVQIKGTTVAASLINVSLSSLPPFGAIVAGTNSLSSSYSVSGSALVGDITIKAPAAFKISTDNNTFADSIVLVNQGGSVPSTTVYTRFSPDAAIGSVSGRILHNSANAGMKFVTVTGISIAQEPTVKSTLSFSQVTGNTMLVTMAGGNGALRILAVKKSSAVNWAPSDGVTVTGADSNYFNAADLGDGNKAVYNGAGTSVTVTGLASNATYHFAVYEYNSGAGNSQNYLSSDPGTGSQTTLAVPTINITPAAIAFGNVGVGQLSAEKVYSLSAATLSPSSGNISVSAPAGYEVSLSSQTGFSNSLNVPYTGGEVLPTNIYVRFSPSALTEYNGSINNSGGSAPAQQVALTGKGMIPNAQQNVSIIVAKDGTGNFTTIQDAINSIPSNNTTMKVILIKDGTYNEKIYISNNFITLVGESRENTKIIYAELRSIWNGQTGGSDWGAATLNINNGVNNIVLANLTIYNNYGTLFGSTDHQFAIRGASSDKIVIINCDIKADGGDTVSLWNVSSGKYYHYNCYFEGYVDFVCPRGWCFISDSRFYQRSASASASIWHDGSANQNSRFVIRNSKFDGVQNFALGRHHLDAQFYLLDNVFSSRMKNQPIFFAASNPPVTLQWGQRYYYYNNHRDSSEFTWYANNLDSAAGSPTADQITAEWTYSTAPATWNPEANFPSVVPNAEFPKPSRGKIVKQRGSTVLSWVPGRRSVSHNVYFGTNDQPPFIGNQTGNTFDAGTLTDSITYYWRIDEVTPYDTVKGEVWSFSTLYEGIIPVELTSFTAESTDGKAKLEWITATETNNSGFDIEKKRENTYWAKVSFVKGAGTSVNKTKYQFVDNDAQSATDKIYYRLKQIDFNGAFRYSNEVRLDADIPVSYKLHQNYPNPFNPETKIKYNIAKKQHVSLKIYDSLGNVIKTLVNDEMEPGYYAVSLSAGEISLASGVYYYRLTSGEFADTKKMIVIK